jgi:agmatine deiminase
VIPHEPDDVIQHADGMVRFVDTQTVFVNDYSKVNPSFGRRLQSVLKRAQLNRISLPYCPVNQVTDGIPSAVGCYANFLMVRGLIVLPTFGISDDDIAKRVFLERAPHFAIESIDCVDLARTGGVLNCVSFSIVAGERSQTAQHVLDDQVGAIEP